MFMSDTVAVVQCGGQHTGDGGRPGGDQCVYGGVAGGAA